MTMDKRANDNQRNAAGYDTWSATYDTDPNSTVFADEHAFPMAWKAVRAQRVLEIGCRKGRHTEKLVAQGNHVTALDLARGMLDVARIQKNHFADTSSALALRLRWQKRELSREFQI